MIFPSFSLNPGQAFHLVEGTCKARLSEVLHAYEAIVFKATQFVEDKWVVDLPRSRFETPWNTAYFD